MDFSLCMRLRLESSIGRVSILLLVLCVAEPTSDQEVCGACSRHVIVQVIDLSKPAPTWF